LFSHHYAHHHTLHSFPTRRSSDLHRNHAPRQGRPSAWRHRGPSKCVPLQSEPAGRWREGRNWCPRCWSKGEKDCHHARPSPHTKDRKSTRLNSSHVKISYAVFCLK